MLVKPGAETSWKCLLRQADLWWRWDLQFWLRMGSFQTGWWFLYTESRKKSIKKKKEILDISLANRL